MELAQRQWRVAEKLSPQADQALADHHPLLRQILFNRGVTGAAEAERYLQALSPEVNDPLLMKGMAAAVDRLAAAVRNGEQIVIYGDYDADGVTATALLLDCIGRLGGQVQPYIPNRFEEGYGLNIEALRSLKEGGADVVVSVDCGIRSLNEAAEARQLGFDLIITDHHSPGAELPDAFAVINPKQPGDEYPEKQLAGVGVAFKLACALEAELRSSVEDSASLLDLVALGTVADMVPLTGENRWMVRNGLVRLRQPHRQGVWSLMGASGLKPARVTAGDIGYLLGPRLNAAGRLETALNALNLLVTSDLFEAGRLAQYLDSQNRERQALTREMTATAEEIVAAQSHDDFLLVAAHEQFNPGVGGRVGAPPGG
ncbi:MAG: DHH family phosphoesterase, partial [Anaerolineales bacterium]|nr:DHH family phosphoesterase [Anaerolineales bacterium]